MAYAPPTILGTYSEDELNDLIVSRACSKYSVNCGCYGGPAKN